VPPSRGTVLGNPVGEADLKGASVDETTALTECGGRGRTVLIGSLRASDAPTTHSDAVDKADGLASVACG